MTDLNDLTDTDIVLNFSQAMTDLYPTMTKIGAYAYDPYDDIVELLFYNMVYSTFSRKYDVNIRESQSHKYEFSPQQDYNFLKMHHIEVVFKNDDVKVMVGNQEKSVSEIASEDNIIIFRNFGDAKHSLTFGIDEEKAPQVAFNKTCFRVLDEDGKMLNQFHSCWVDNKDVDFKFVTAQ